MATKGVLIDTTKPFLYECGRYGKVTRFETNNFAGRITAYFEDYPAIYTTDGFFYSERRHDELDLRLIEPDDFNKFIDNCEKVYKAKLEQIEMEPIDICKPENYYSEKYGNVRNFIKFHDKGDGYQILTVFENFRTEWYTILGKISQSTEEDLCSLKLKKESI